jgi:hypothetical protein
MDHRSEKCEIIYKDQIINIPVMYEILFISYYEHDDDGAELAGYVRQNLTQTETVVSFSPKRKY